MDKQPHKPPPRKASPRPRQRPPQAAQQHAAMPAGTAPTAAGKATAAAGAAPAAAVGGLFGSVSPLTAILVIAGGSFAVVLVAVAVGAGVFAVVWAGSGSADPELEAMIAEYEREDEPEPLREPFRATERAPQEPPSAPEPKPDEVEPAPPVEVPPDYRAPKTVPKQPEPPKPPLKNPDPPPPLVDPFEEVKKLERRLPFPIRKHGDFGVPKPVELTTILVDSPLQCEMSLVGLDHVVKDGLSLTTESIDDDGTRELKIELSGAGLLKPQEVGRFVLDGRKLRFAWGRRATSVPLQYCLLRLEAPGNNVVLCHLGNAQEVEPVRLTFDGTQAIPRSISSDVAEMMGHLPVPAAENGLGSPSLKVQIWPEGFPEHDTDLSLPGTPTDSGILAIGQADIHVLGDRSATSIFDIEAGLSLNPEDQALNVHLKNYYFPRMIDERTGTERAQRMEARRHGRVSRKPAEESEEAPTLGELKKMCDAFRETAKEEMNKTQRDLTKKQALLDPAQDVLSAQEQAYDRKNPLPPDASYSVKKNHAQERSYALRPYQEKVAIYKRHVDELELSLRTLQQRQEFAEKNSLWCEQMKALMDELETKGSIHFRVYFELAGEEIDLVRTKRS